MKPEVIQSNVNFVFNSKAHVFGNISVRRRQSDGKKIGPTLWLIKSNLLGSNPGIERIAIQLTEQLIDSLKYLIGSCGSVGETSINIDRPGKGSVVKLNGEKEKLTLQVWDTELVISNNRVEDSAELLRAIEFMEKVLREINTSEFVIGSSIPFKLPSFPVDGLEITLLDIERPFRFDRMNYLITNANETFAGISGVRSTLVTGLSKFTLSLLDITHSNYQFSVERYSAFLQALKVALRGCHKTGVHYINNTPPIQFVSWEITSKAFGDGIPGFWLTLFDHTYNQTVQFPATEYVLAVLIEKLEASYDKWCTDNNTHSF